MSDVSVVVVTGASGFIGAHIVKACLERGYNVNACVRNKDDPKNEFLTAMGAELPGDVTLYSADLVTAGAYDDACADADAVIHAAAQVDPFVVVDPIKDMVEPSTEGVKNILSSVNKCPDIKHFVQTSSMAAVGGAVGRPVSEEDWNTQGMEGWEEAPALAYNFAKAEGERTVWAETEGKPYSVSAINPAMVWGPCLAKAHAKASPFVFRQALYGNDQPNGQFSVVDVRDVALAHVLAMEKPEANGKRFILDGDGYHSDSLRGNVIAVNDVIAKCREYFPDYQFTDAPGENPAAIKPGFRTTDNTLSKEVLGLEYTDMGETFKDSVSSMVDNGFVPAKPAAKL